MDQWRLISVFVVGLMSASIGFGAPRIGLPNIVVILSDDLGYGDLGCYHSQSKIPTPHLDRLAGEGMRFTDAHAPASVCTPTRYALLTGRYAWRTWLKGGVLGPWDRPLIEAERLTVPALLKKHGYATHCVGKWHLGWEWPTKNGASPSARGDRLSNVDFTQSIGGGPITRGFDSYFGTDVPNYPPYCFLENDRTVGLPNAVDGGRADGFNRPGPMLPGWKLVEILPELTKRAVRRVEDAAKAGQPFFLYFALTSPHYPVVPAPEFRGKSKAGDYGDFVVQTDWSVGEVLAALEREGVAENTLVIFTSDNGPEVTGEVRPGVYDRARKFGHYSMGDLRGAKRDLWEGGHRVPFIARWPRRIQPGSQSSETICLVDLLATMAAVTGEKLPSNAGEDSVNLLPVFLGEKAEHPVREATVYHSLSGQFAIRKGAWVLIKAMSGDDNGAEGEPLWLKQERGYREHGQVGELYRLDKDLEERVNQFADHPEVVSELQDLLQKYQAEGRSTLDENQRGNPTGNSPRK